MNQADQLYLSVGGRLVASGSSLAMAAPYWDFGWLSPDRRSDEQHAAHEATERTFSTASVFGTNNEDADKADLTRNWKHPRVIQALGFAFPGAHQLTGSCVGAGADQMVQSLNFFEVCTLGQPEKIFLCFYPYHYGRGRLASGDRGRGEGSTGSGQAKALKEDGVMDNAIDGLPKPQKVDDGIIWGSSVEMAWSAGDKIDEKYISEGRRHPVTDVAKMTNSDDVRKALVNGKPCTCASMYAFRAKVEGEGQDAILLGRHQGSWSHQMSLHAYWKHPKFGPIFWLQNNWGLNAHGIDPGGMPPGGAWITANDVDWICRSGGETYAFAGLTGWSAPTIDWENI